MPGGMGTARGKFLRYAQSAREHCDGPPGQTPC